MKGKGKKITIKMNPPSDNRIPLEHSNRFFDDVFDIVRLIPTGRVTTYGAIAKYLGTALSARMVGWAMNASHRLNPPIPAHRVVNRNGMLSGRMHFETPSTMEERLTSEGLIVKDNTISQFEQVFWDPSKEIDV
jgi:methylated-DNA-protein-cysteine methyltransferase-like protein